MPGIKWGQQEESFTLYAKGKKGKDEKKKEKEKQKSGQADRRREQGKSVSWVCKIPTHKRTQKEFHHLGIHVSVHIQFHSKEERDFMETNRIANSSPKQRF